MSEYCSLSGTDLLREVPSLLCSWPGSTRASTAVLSQIEPTPGAVIAAQAVPEDCGTLPPLASFSDSSSEAVSVPWRATVMSAPIRVSQNGESDCLTDTADAPFGLSFDDHAASALAVLFGAARAFGAAPGQRRGVDIELAPVELADVDVLQDVGVVDIRRHGSFCCGAAVSSASASSVGGRRLRRAPAPRPG